MTSRARNRQIPIHRRSRSAHHLPFQTITETYTKETTTRPMQIQDDDSIPDVVYVLEDEYDRVTPPLIRRRNDYPVVRVTTPTRSPSRVTEYFKETIDFEEIEKYTKWSPQFAEKVYLKESPKNNDSLSVSDTTKNHAPPTCHVIPPTPEKIKNRLSRCEYGIPLQQNAEKSNLPMYEEYIRTGSNNNITRGCPPPPPQSQKPKIDENHNSEKISCVSAPVPLPRNKSPSEEKTKIFSVPEKAPRGNYRFIDSDSAESSPGDNRYVYTHDLFVDSATGRPFTPGRQDLDDKNCGKLKINVYFKPPHPPVVSTYTLDEIEIEKPEKVFCPPPPPPPLPLRPSSTVPSNTNCDRASSEQMFQKRFPSHTSLLRKESEILTVPLEQTKQVRPASKCSNHSANSKRTIERQDVQIPRNASRSTLQSLEEKNRVLDESRKSVSNTSERNIPIRIEEKEIDMDEIFPKMLASPQFQSQPQPPTVLQTRKSSSIHDIVHHDKSSSSIYERTSVYPESHHSFARAPSAQNLEKSSSFGRTPSQKSYEKPLSDHCQSPNPPKKNDESFEHQYPRKTQVPQDSKQKPFHSRPYEEVVHIKERYERDETIRRFYPTTTV